MKVFTRIINPFILFCLLLYHCLEATSKRQFISISNDQPNISPKHYFSDLEEKVMKHQFPNYTREYNIQELLDENKRGIHPSNVKYKKPIICGICTANFTETTKPIPEIKINSTVLPVKNVTKVKKDNPFKQVVMSHVATNDVKQYGVYFNKPIKVDKYNFHTQTNIKIYPSSNVIVKKYIVEEKEIDKTVKKALAGNISTKEEITEITGRNIKEKLPGIITDTKLLNKGKNYKTELEQDMEEESKEKLALTDNINLRSKNRSKVTPLSHHKKPIKRKNDLDEMSLEDLDKKLEKLKYYISQKRNITFLKSYSQYINKEFDEFRFKGTGNKILISNSDNIDTLSKPESFDMPCFNKGFNEPKLNISGTGDYKRCREIITKFFLRNQFNNTKKSSIETLNIPSKYKPLIFYNSTKNVNLTVTDLKKFNKFICSLNMDKLRTTFSMFSSSISIDKLCFRISYYIAYFEMFKTSSEKTILKFEEEVSIQGGLIKFFKDFHKVFFVKGNEFVFFSFLSTFFLSVLFWLYYEDIIKYFVLLLVSNDLKNENILRKLSFYYNNPQVRYNLLYKPHSFIKQKYGNCEFDTEDISQLISEEEFLKQVDKDDTLSEILYNSAYFIHNLKVSMFVQLLRFVIFISFLTSFYLLLSEFYTSSIKIVIVMLTFLLGIILSVTALRWCYSKSAELNCGSFKADKFMILAVEKK